MLFNSNSEERKNIVQLINLLSENYYSTTESYPVADEWNPKEIKAFAQKFNFDSLHSPEEIIHMTVQGLEKYTIHTPHPRYFGLFNPRTEFLSAVSDYITAIFNPQMAAWSHAPFANEIERLLIQKFAQKFGYKSDAWDGTFCSGGSEANLTAVISALNHHFPAYRDKGLITIPKKLLIYCSKEVHHSIGRAARVAGLGEDAVIQIPTNESFEMDLSLLETQIQEDILEGFQPLMLVGTAGTTGLGAIDNLEACAEIAQKYGLWFHVDAAYGGAVIIPEKTKAWLKGIEKSDSITLDLHKWFSQPMGSSLFLTAHKSILGQSFGLDADYVPKDNFEQETIDSYTHSIQWSRRFIGLKIFLPLAVYGWKGFEETISYQIKMGNQLRDLLQESGWTIQNNSKLPIICFNHSDLDNQQITELIEKVSTSGKVWVSQYPIQGKNTIRACITNYGTTEEDLAILLQVLNDEKKSILEKSEFEWINNRP